MSYYATFKPTEEAANKLKSWSEPEKEKKWIADMKYRLLIMCMTGGDNGDVQKTIDDIRFDLSYLSKFAESNSRNASYEQYNEEKEIWFCGWEYSRLHDAPDMSETEEYVLKELLLETFVIPTPEYVGNEEIFYEKVGRITELLDYFVETAEKAANFAIMEELKEFRVSDIGEEEKETSDVSDEPVQETDGEEDCGCNSNVSVSVTGDDERADITFTPTPKQVPSFF